MTDLSNKFELRLGLGLAISALAFLFFGQANAATLSLSPSSSTVNAGDIFKVNILLDTQGDEAHGVDINALNYDPTFLEVQDDNSSVAGVQILPGTIMPINVFNSVSGGDIVFSQITTNGQTYNGQGTLASVRFKALQTGITFVNFDFTSGSTLDTNVASNGHDILSSVVNGTYTVNAAVNPTPIPTPAPSGGGGGGGSGSFNPVPGSNTISDTTSNQTTSSSARPSDHGLKEGDMISAAGSNDPDIYIINEHGYKRLFLNPVIFGFYGHLGGFSNVKTVNSNTRDVFGTTQLFRNCETNDSKIYALNVTGEDSGTLHHLNMSGTQAVNEDPDFFKKVFCINNNEFNWYSKAGAFNSLTNVPVYIRAISQNNLNSEVKKSILVKTSDGGVIYHVNANGVKKPIPAGDVFYSYGNKLEDVSTVTNQELQSYPDFQGIIYNSKVYVIENNTKRWVSGLNAFSGLGLSWSRIVSVNETEFNYYTDGSFIQ